MIENFSTEPDALLPDAEGFQRAIAAFNTSKPSLDVGDGDEPISPTRKLNGQSTGAASPINADGGTEDLGFFGTLADMGKGLFAGGYDAVAETVNLGSDAVNLFREEDNQVGPIIGESGIEIRTTAGQITKTISQFVLGFIGAGKFLRAAKLLQGAGKAVTVGRGMVQGAIADFTVFDGNEGRLSNLIESNPALANPITDFLAADENDSAAIGRFKNTLEGMALGAVGEALFVIIKGMKASRAAKTVSEAEEAVIRTADELETLSTRTNQSPEKLAAQVDAAITGDAQPLVDAVEAAGGKVELSVRGTDATSVQEIAEQVGGRIGENQHVMATKESLTNKLLTPEEWGKILDTGIARGETWDEILENELLIGRGISFKTLEEADLADAFVQAVFDRTLKGKGVQTHAYLRESAQEWVQAMGHQGVLDGAAHDAKLMEHLAKRHIAYKMETKTLGLEITKMWDSMKLRGENPLDSEQFIKLSEAYQKLSMATKDGITTAARMLNAQKIKPDYLSPEVMAGILKATDGDAEKILKVLNMHRTGRWRGAITELVINGLLSSPKTHLVNTFGNMMKTILMPAEKMLGGVFMGNKQMVIEGAQTYAGLFKFCGDAWKSAKMAFKTSDNILDAGHKVMDRPEKSIMSSYDKIKEGIINRRLASGGDTKAPLSELEELQARLMSFIGLPSRALLGMDELFKQLNYRSNVYAKHTAEAMVKFGNDTDRIAEYVANGMSEAFERGGRGLDAGALRYAQETTWTQPLRDGAYVNVGQGFTNLVNTVPALRLVMPFIRTPTNLIRDAVAHTPGLNLVTKRFRDAIKEGGERAAHAYGQMATGSLLWVSAIGLAYSGKITGGYPKDPATRQAWIDSGIEPYSFKIGDKYIGFGRMDPFSTFFGIAADFSEYARNWSDSAKGNFASGAIMSLANNLLSKSYLTGLTDLMDALGDQSVDSKALQKYLLRSSTMFVPYSSGLRFTRQLTDDSMREVRGFFDTLMNTIPGASSLLPERRSWLTGKAISHNLFWSTHRDDPVANELARLGDNLSIGAPGKKLKGVELDGDQYTRLCELQGTIKIGGLTQHERLERMMKSPSYDIGRRRIPDMPGDLGNPRTKMVEDIIRQYRTAAQRKLLQEDDALAEAAQQEFRVRQASKQGNLNRYQELLTMPK